jgi:2-polyprenyl-6-hydroxyphenyl methylase/3-demethylubiquinone-9 3-methyltransferase
VQDGIHDLDEFIRPSQIIGWVEEHRLKCIDAAASITTQPNLTIGNHKLNDSLDVNYILCCRKL